VESASESDLSILQGSGFLIQAKSVHPPVKDRINSVNALPLTDQGGG